MPDRNRWRFDPDNWPDQRFYWNDMNRGQKGQIIWAYNRARQNKGLPAVPNPYRSNELPHLNPDGTDTITPRTPGRDPIYPQYGPAALESVRLSRAQLDAIQPDPNSPDPDDFEGHVSMETYDNYFRTAEGQNVLERIANLVGPGQLTGNINLPTVSDSDFDDADGAGPSNAPDMAPPPKRPRAEEAAGEGGAAAGTAEPVAARAAGHNAASDGGFDSAQGPISVIKKGGYSCQGGSMKFTKVHRMTSWAIPYWRIASTERGGSNLITTPLATIPWEYMAFYCSPEEFELIPAGSYVSSCHIEIMQTTATTGYPTGGSTASVAQTNHPKVLVIGDDLVAKMRGGFNRKVTINSDMIPQTLTDSTAVLNDFIDKQYGTDQTAADASVIVPGAGHSIPYYNKSHFCIYQPNFTQAGARGFDETNAPGFEYFQNCIVESNANDSTWASVASRSYKFESAPIGERFQPLEILTTPTSGTGYDQSIGHSVTSHNMLRKTDNIQPTGGTYSDLTYTERIIPSAINTVPLVTYKSSQIEKGSHYVRGDVAHTPARQPSFHIGMRAIDKADPSLDQSRADKFTHARIEFQIKATLFVKLPSYPNRFMRPKYYNVSMENAEAGIGWYPNDSDNQKIVSFGLYTSIETPPALNRADIVEEEDGSGNTRRLRRRPRALPTVQTPRPKKRRNNASASTVN